MSTPSNIVIDLVEGAELDHGVQGSVLQRIAYVYGLDVGFQSGDPSALFRALAVNGMPQWHDAHPTATPYTCNRHVITPMSDSSAKVVIYYVTGPAQAPASTWLVTESTALMTVTTQIHPGTGEVITVTSPAGLNTPPMVATMTFDIPLLRLTYEGWISRTMVPGSTTPTQPNTTQFNQAVGSVNEAPWNGYTVGFWKFSEWSDQTQDRGVSYTIRAGFLNKITEDWSSWEVLRDPNSGKLIAPNPDDVKSLRNIPYAYFVQQKPGITKSGNYRTIDFASLFGG